MKVGRASLGPSVATEVLYSFGFAQCYRAIATNQNGGSPYRSRCVMLIRGDYVAIHDELESGAEGKFNWTNEANGLVWQVFGDTEFQKPIKSFTNDERFLLMLTDDQIRDFSLPKSTFSIRSDGQFFVPVAGRYKFRTTWKTHTQDVPEEDTVRLYMDDHKIFDSKGPSTAEVELEARPYALRFEYVHASNKPPYLSLACMRPDKPNYEQLDNSNFGTQHPMPFIQQVHGGPGNQLHIVAPEKLDVAKVSSGARIGSAEFVLFSDVSATEGDESLHFPGKAGYASNGAVAFFEGTHIERNGLGLSRSDGDFGASVKLTKPNVLEGHVAGRSGGTLHIHLPAQFPVEGLKVTFDGHNVPVTVEESILAMPVTVKQSDGVKTYRITA